MTSREIVRRTIDHDNASRLPFDCLAHGKRYTDMVTTYLDWDYEYEKQSWVEGGREYYTDVFGSIWFRVLSDRATKGGIFQGFLEESWEESPSATRIAAADPELVLPRSASCDPGLSSKIEEERWIPTAPS